MPQDFLLPRSGSAPLAFTGEQLAYVSGKDIAADKRATRYHEIGLYRAASGRYVVAIHFVCQTKYDDPYDEAEAFDTPREVVQYLEEFEPLEGVRGWTQEKHAEQQERLKRALTNNFERLVSELLSSQAEFAERV